MEVEGRAKVERSRGLRTGLRFAGPAANARAVSAWPTNRQDWRLGPAPKATARRAKAQDVPSSACAPLVARDSGVGFNSRIGEFRWIGFPFGGRWRGRLRSRLVRRWSAPAGCARASASRTGCERSRVLRLALAARPWVGFNSRIYIPPMKRAPAGALFIGGGGGS